MKTNNRYREDPVQDLLNAVVVQAAVDYRDYCARLLKNPKDWSAKKEREAVRRFFLSEDFCCYTNVGGRYILNKLNEELNEFAFAYTEYQKEEAELQKKARSVARLLMQKQRHESMASEISEKLLPEAEKKVHELIHSLRERQMEMPDYAKKIMKYPRFETVMYVAYQQLQEDILNGKESLWG